MPDYWIFFADTTNTVVEAESLEQAKIKGAKIKPLANPQWEIITKYWEGYKDEITESQA